MPLFFKKIIIYLETNRWIKKISKERVWLGKKLLKSTELTSQRFAKNKTFIKT